MRWLLDSGLKWLKMAWYAIETQLCNIFCTKLVSSGVFWLRNLCMAHYVWCAENLQQFRVHLCNKSGGNKIIVTWWQPGDVLTDVPCRWGHAPHAHVRCAIVGPVIAAVCDVGWRYWYGTHYTYTPWHISDIRSLVWAEEVWPTDMINTLAVLYIMCYAHT